MSSKPLLLFAGGGTGGHLFPAIAIIEWLRQSGSDVRCEFLCTDRPIDTQILRQANVPFKALPVRPFVRTPGGLIQFVRGWRKSLGMSRERFKRDRPSVVIGTGGYGSGPAVKVASKLGVPVALLNPDAIPGQANRFLARLASAIFVQWQQTEGQFSSSRNIIAAGCPVRSSFHESCTGQEYALFGLDPQLKTLLITGASTGALTINRAFELLAHDLSRINGWQLLHISGSEDEHRLKRTYADAGLTAKVLSFTNEMAAATRVADLAVARAGAVTVAELMATTTPSILMPYPYHKDMHQAANAQMLVKCGAAKLLLDTKTASTNAALLRDTLLPLMNNARQLSSMSAALQQLPRRESAKAISGHLLDMAKTAISRD